jgi:hypothetical protein
MAEEDKARVTFSYYDDVMGTPACRTNSINLEMLDLPRSNMHELDEHFSEDDVWRVIRVLPLDKTPEPNGFATRFLLAVWHIISLDLMLALDAISQFNMRSFHDLNRAPMVLLPKTAEADTIKDFKPISLIHYLGKLVSKIFAKRLAPRLPELIHHSQSAFIKCHYIHDNFRFV